jgi:hypothetical protein
MPPALKSSSPEVASFRQERALTEWLNFTFCPPDSSLALPHPVVFLQVSG